MNFSVLPPEVNSARMFAGAGSGPTLTAAAAWGRLADELATAASSFNSATATLAGQSWLGRAATAMAAGAAPYTSWLTLAAAHAQRAAEQAREAVAGYEAARAATVHPVLVATNRGQLVSLALSNLFGQNTPAIAAAEANYEQMWAQDVTAMSGYHAQVSAAAAQLAHQALPQINFGIGNLGNLNIGNGYNGNDHDASGRNCKPT
ncbi:PPE family protein, partial [Mycobacterium kansasii]|uniref:PPE family protein n=1 Tax=Mycobacterium kansasii TaxID=1768 RepID=UPI0012906B7C